MAPAGVGVTVTLDENPPTLTITKPVDATPSDDTSPRISTVTTGGGIAYPLINGTVTDGTGPGNGIQKVQVRVWKSDPARYWNPGAFAVVVHDPGSGQRHGVVSGAFDDELDDGYATFSFLTDYKYHIEARAQDLSGTYSVTFATISFVMDQNVPVSRVTTPANATTIRTLSGIVGTMAETGTRYPGSVSSVKIAIRELGPPSNGQWWDDLNKTFTLGTAPTTDDATLYTSSWTFSGMTSGDLTSGRRTPSRHGRETTRARRMTRDSRRRLGSRGTRRRHSPRSRSRAQAACISTACRRFPEP